MNQAESAVEPEQIERPDAREVVREVTGRVVATREHAHPVPPRFHYPVVPHGVGVAGLHEDLVTAKEPFSERADEFRALRTELVETSFAMTDRRSLAVLSDASGDGRTYVAANLAVSFSQFGARTLLVDANLRRPGLPRLLGRPHGPGLAELLAGRIGEEESVSPVPGIEGLHVLHAGAHAGDPVRLLQGGRFAMVLQWLETRFDQVVIDTPADAQGPDGRLIAVHAGSAVVIGRRGHSRVASLRRLLGRLDRSPCFVAGVVMNEH